MSRLERYEKVALWTAGLAAALGFLTSAGCGPLPPAPATWVQWLHPVLLLVGAVAGVLASARTREIETGRWRTVEEAGLTRMERDWAHKEAERRRRWAGTSFVAAPLALGYWLAYQLESQGPILAANLLPVTGVVGAAAGYVAAWLRQRRRDVG